MNSDGEIMRCVVRNIRSQNVYPVERWVAIRDLCGVGSSSSVELCKRFGADPHETVSPVFYRDAQADDCE